MSSVCMAKVEHPERYIWWLNELESLGVNTLEKNGLNNYKEASDLTEAISKLFMKIIFKLIVKATDSEAAA